MRTKRQDYIFDNFDRIIVRRKMSGQVGYFLDGQDCLHSISSMLVRGLLVRGVDGVIVKKKVPPNSSERCNSAKGELAT